MTDAYRRLGPPMEMRLTAREMELENQSRVVCLPCREDTIRGDAIPLCPGSGERGIAWIASLRKRCEAEHSRCALAHLSPDDHSPLTVSFCTMGQGTGKKCSMTRRTRAREVALQLLFQRDHNPGLTRADLERFAAERLRDERLQQFC
ncbi:MAG TPA: hypothetical protein VKD72_33280, partial [Gemmataceae bacterium]|nr:hypothetical protein [Gemmataceae bacterium]